MKRQNKIILKSFISITMFAFFILSTTAVYMVDKTGMSTSTMFKIAIGIVNMLGLSVLYIVHVLDSTPADNSSRLFSGMILMAYLGTICDNLTWIISWLVNYHEQRILFSVISYTLDVGSFLVMPIMLALFWNYQSLVFSGESRINPRIKWTINIFAVIDILYIIIGSATHYIFYINENGKYTEGNGAVFTYIYPAIIVCLCVVENLRSKLPLKKKISLLSVGLLPAITIISSMLLPEYNFVYVLFFVDLILVYGTVQSQKGIELAEHGKKIAEQNQKLIEQQTQIMISQIQPHFLYNTLTSIHQLCDVNTELAQKTIQDFSAYLRGNMDGIKSLSPIPFEKELSHTKTYLAIELLRFSDILNIEYDIRVTDFEIPALTLQPLVENAVKYGIRSRDDGGTVSISTKRENGKIYVSVRDDGMGFDPNEIKRDDKSHTGIENTRTRLQLMMGASLIIDSEVGVGTTATIILEDKNESVIS